MTPLFTLKTLQKQIMAAFGFYLINIFENLRVYGCAPPK